MSKTVAVIDYGMGNLHSISKALQVANQAHDADILITRDADTIRNAERVVLPGVGAIRDTMAELAHFELIAVLREAISNKPFLGICLGMQALLDHSEENGGVDCLGLIPGEVKAFAKRAETDGLTIPHMGWNEVFQTQAHPMWQSIPDGARFYFVHSYYVAPTDRSVNAGETDYGIRFTAALTRDNIFASQFHPEKSQKAGLQLLANFLAWQP